MATVELSTKATTQNRPDPFKGDGDVFITWQNQMLFYLTTLGLQKCIEKDEPKHKDGQTREKDVVVFLGIDSWKHSDFLC